MDASFAALLAAARAGSRDALGQLLDVYGPHLLGVARHSLPPRLMQKCGSSDLVQETFVEAQHDFPNFRGATPEELRAWLLRILSRNVADVCKHYRTSKRAVVREVTGPGGLPDPDLADRRAESPSELARRQEEIDVLVRALAKLPDGDRAIVFLRAREGLSFEEIARRTGISSADAARKRCERAIGHVRERMRRYE